MVCEYVLVYRYFSIFNENRSLSSLWEYNRFEEIGTAGNSFFHFLVPEDTEGESSDDQWHGRLIALERTIKSVAGKNEKAFAGQLTITNQTSAIDFVLLRDQ